MWYRAESEGRWKEIVKVILERSNRKFDENLIPNNDNRICNDTIQVGTWTCVCVWICVALWNVELMPELKLGLIQTRFIIFWAWDMYELLITTYRATKEETKTKKARWGIVLQVYIRNHHQSTVFFG